MTVAEYIRGDVNGDGEVDMKDLLMLRRCTAGVLEDERVVVFRNADVVEDGNLDLKDILMIRRIIAGVEN